MRKDTVPVSEKEKRSSPMGSKDKSKNTSVASVINTVLADEFSLFTKTLNFHWNITGKRFHTLHTFLEEQYRELLEVMDEVAERVRIIGERPLSTVSEMYSATTLNESPGKVPNADHMLSELLKDHLTIQSNIKKALDSEDLFSDDPSTEDFLVGLLGKHEKMSWMLKSHVADESLN
jgi:starvation-inducible DNA-binding protein